MLHAKETGITFGLRRLYLAVIARSKSTNYPSVCLLVYYDFFMVGVYSHKKKGWKDLLKLVFETTTKKKWCLLLKY